MDSIRGILMCNGKQERPDLAVLVHNLHEAKELLIQRISLHQVMRQGSCTGSSTLVAPSCCFHILSASLQHVCCGVYRPRI